ncbi:acyl-CoA synthetase (AMP-forming)/AMP-acid ligase II [Salirhabdus euzebyi]|uniref:Acyl-CoA synthetase (AMP-forming)/AMP-acid ligase II n=1 Tax=Salirhabdus euzebyi TaxID=394506 RepID=A0A841Q9I6_9BACI|nr:AMP-binding protein [Salirhabdus euzebyi]MBB6455349.1 acyl-CoA synthetase (AMP-forming)/AMP-acid ligase II [Salirhabdus euzebyi]
MRIIKLIYVLYKIKLLSPLGLYRLMVAIYKCGFNLMTLLHFAEKKFAKQLALVDDDETISFQQLLAQSNQLSCCLKEEVHLHGGQKVGFLCRNHASLVKSIFAVSRLGADVYLLNTEISSEQLNEMITRHDFDLFIYDIELSALIEQSHYSKEKVFSYHHSLPAINNFLNRGDLENKSLPRISSGKIILQTSGSTGISKDASHKPSLFNYLSPFMTFIKRLKILHYQTVYIATPIYHGYGIAVILLFLTLGKKSVITKRFDANKACRLIRDHEIEVITVVPSMLQKILREDTEALKSIACIASGGAKLRSKLVEETFHELGEVLYNLYGTSEAGLNFIATPQDLLYSSSTVGRKINGVKLKVLDENMNEVDDRKIGQLCIQNKWSISNKNNPWIKTGDLGYKDDNGYYFLSGRTDDMVISGGENVYPIEVEQVLINHSLIEDVVVIGVNDEQFGQRLKAFVLPIKDVNLTEEALLEWIRLRVARFQVPKEIKFVENIPYNELGKLDKKQLIKENNWQV